MRYYGRKKRGRKKRTPLGYIHPNRIYRLARTAQAQKYAGIDGFYHLPKKLFK